MGLSDWLASGLIKPHESSRAEVHRILGIADRDLADANVKGLSIDRRFATAYSAALQLATLVLRASGYRSASNAAGHHWRTISLLPELMGSGQTERKRYLDSCRRARNEADYDRVNVVSNAELLELLQDTLTFRGEVLEWLRGHHPELL